MIIYKSDKEIFKESINTILSIHSFTLTETFLFPAYITNFSDSVTCNWTPTTIYGHMDPVYTYKNTTRKISLSFDILGQTSTESINNFNMIKKIQAGLYPIYQKHPSDNQIILLNTPPVFSIKYANIIKSKTRKFLDDGLFGYIDDIDFKPELESGHFIVNNSLYPKLYKLNFNFNPIHDYPLGYVIKNNTIKLRTDQEKQEEQEEVLGDFLNTPQNTSIA